MAIVSLLLFAGMWFVLVKVFARMSGMDQQCDKSGAGDLVESTRYGSASINGVSMSNCVSLHSYEMGFALKVMWVFGGGERYVPYATVSEVEHGGGPWFMPRHQTLILADGTKIRLFGRLSGAVEKQYSEYLALTGPSEIEIDVRKSE